MNDFLKTLAPLLGTAIAGPFGGIAASFLADKLGVSEKTVSAVTEALSTDKMTPDQVAQIKLAEIDFKKWMGDNEIKQEQIVLQEKQLVAEDRKDARGMQIATRSPLVAAIAIIVLVSFISVVIGTLLGYSKIESAMAGTLVGYLSAKAEQVIAFYFGSSAGSQAKDLMIHNSTPN
jgi:hypothetical protein